MLKVLGVSQFVVTITCPLAIMSGYAVWHIRKPRTPLNLVGDNLYYLGLLFTLVSLAVSLFEFSPSDEDIESITPIITNFGIAIFSTIIGVAFRVYFNLQYTGLEDMEREVHVNMTEALREFSAFRLEMRQFIREGATEAKKVIDAEVKNFADTIQVAGKSFDESRQKLQEKFDQTYQSLQLAVNDFSQTIRASDKRFEESQEKLQERFDETYKGLQSAVNDFSQIIRASDKSFDESRQKLQEKFDQTYQSLQLAVNDFSQTIRASDKRFEESQQKLVDHVEKGSDLIGSAGERLAVKLNTITIPTDELEKSLQQSTNTFEASIKGITKKIDNIEIPENLVEKILHSAPFTSLIKDSTEQIRQAGDHVLKQIKEAQAVQEDHKEPNLIGKIIRYIKGKS